jgi:hypothetical protein
VIVKSDVELMGMVKTMLIGLSKENSTKKTDAIVIYDETGESGEGSAAMLAVICLRLNSFIISPV